MTFYQQKQWCVSRGRSFASPRGRKLAALASPRCINGLALPRDYCLGLASVSSSASVLPRLVFMKKRWLAGLMIHQYKSHQWQSKCGFSLTSCSGHRSHILGSTSGGIVRGGVKCTTILLLSSHSLLMFGGVDFLTRSAALGFRLSTDPTQDTIYLETDNKLFMAIKFNSSHLFHHLLPPRRDAHYSLRPVLMTILSIRTTSLIDNNFINRMLYKNIGCIW